MEYYALYHGTDGNGWMGKATGAIIQANNSHEAITIANKLLREKHYAISVAVVGTHNNEWVIEMDVESKPLASVSKQKYWLSKCLVFSLEGQI